MTTEIWKPIPGYDGYEASNLGRIRSLKRGYVKILKQSDNGHGYMQVACCNSDSRGPRRVHSLVALAFLGPRPDGLVCCHNDGDKLNNRPENLRYDTQKSNIMDAILAGKMRILSSIQVAEILEKFNGGTSRRELAKQYGVNYTTITNVLRRETDFVPYRHKNEQTRIIREEYATGNIKLNQLAERYNMDQSAISLIITGKRRAKADGPIKGIDY